MPLNICFQQHPAALNLQFFFALRFRHWFALLPAVHQILLVLSLQLLFMKSEIRIHGKYRFFRLLCQLVQFVTLGHHTPCQSIRARVTNNCPYISSDVLLFFEQNTTHQNTLWNLQTSKSKQKMSPSHSKVHARYAIVLGRRTCPCCVNIEPHIQYTE